MSTLRNRLWLLGFRCFVAWKRGIRVWHGRVLRNLDQEKRSREALARAAPAVPRIIWMYWAQGWETAPLLARLSLHSWIARNPGWTVLPLDRETARRYVDLPAYVENRDMGHAHRADILRVALLARHGGVWADATTICGRALDDWLPLVCQSGFFAFSRPGPDRRLSNWFLAAAPGNTLLLAWHSYIERYWSLSKRADAYHWAHYLFDLAVRSSRETRSIWSTMPKLSNHLANMVQYNAFATGLFPAVRNCVANGAIPVHKLSSKLDIPPRFGETPLAAILGVESVEDALSAIDRHKTDIVDAIANANGAGLHFNGDRVAQ